MVILVDAAIGFCSHFLDLVDSTGVDHHRVLAGAAARVLPQGFQARPIDIRARGDGCGGRCVHCRELLRV
ncbi:hypothetical protein GN958_ATG00017 [Phytophthora infestans]|uniref:Uncharacterized protein n=1 Tax=Phytophthora infestans TaxID=4787 RepID=A0A8S9VGY8_PHYIN|nr:hypothetical protein GN958_ATG01160 [Phytophthora infestans]KAF4150794.1 hypothetical protein GN958_ATG00017 [Phytophthora infestans]